MSKTPLVDLKAQYKTIKEEIDSAIFQVIENSSFIQGKYVKDFEKCFGEALGTTAEKVVGCSNGTSAISLSLNALGIGPGDEVITTSHTFFATVEAILGEGAIPVMVDIKPEDYTIDTKAVEAAITPKTRAIIPVHIYGAMCDMDELTSLARKHNLLIVEDCAQAHLASWNNISAGLLGDAGTFSFYPGKNLGAYGDGGAITAKDSTIADIARKIADHGRQSKYLHDLVGCNSRLDGLQAAILSVKLNHLEMWTENRRKLARAYDHNLEPLGFKVIKPDHRCNPVYHLYVVEVSNRDEVRAELEKHNISTGIHYPVPLHRQPAMNDADTRVHDMSVTDTIVDRIISLPLYPELSTDKVNQISEIFAKIARP